MLLGKSHPLQFRKESQNTNVSGYFNTSAMVQKISFKCTLTVTLDKKAS